MPADPRLEIVGQAGTEPVAGLTARVADLERQLNALTSNRPVFQTLPGTPTIAARSGTGVVDTTATKLWMRVGGTWRYVTLT